MAICAQKINGEMMSVLFFAVVATLSLIVRRTPRHHDALRRCRHDGARERRAQAQE